MGTMLEPALCACAYFGCAVVTWAAFVLACDFFGRSGNDG